MKSKISYYSGATVLDRMEWVRNADFLAMGGKITKHNRIDSFKCLAGRPVGGGDLMPVTRKIQFKAFPSLHKCSGKCRSAKGHVCECECGGSNHGIDA